MLLRFYFEDHAAYSGMWRVDCNVIGEEGRPISKVFFIGEMKIHVGVESWGKVYMVRSG